MNKPVSTPKKDIVYGFTGRRYLEQSDSETESRMVVCQGQRRRRNGELVFNGYRVVLFQDEKSNGDGR